MMQSSFVFLNQLKMKSLYQFLCCTVALGLCAGQLFAQQGDFKLPGSGLQAYHPIRKWRGVDIQSYLRGIGYFGGAYNTATGTQALYQNTGGYNTADGYQAMYASTTAAYDVAVGYQALSNCTSCYENTAIGSLSMFQSASGVLWSTAVGTRSLEFLTTGWGNTAVGNGAGGGITTGGNNVAVGYAAQGWVTGAGNNNIAIGGTAMGYTSGSNNTAVGNAALYGANGSSESNSTGIGFDVLYYSNSATGNNTAAGNYSMYENTTGGVNATSGAYTLYSNTTGSQNSAIGAYALYGNTSGYNNAANGYLAMYQNTSGYYNLADGAYAGCDNTTGSDNTAVGGFATVSSGALSNTTALGYEAIPSSSNQIILGNSSVTSIGGAVGWTNFSDGRYKKNIQQNVPGLAFINRLTPITYTLDIDGIETKLHQNDKSPSIKGLTSKPNYLDDPILKQAIQEKSAITYTGFVAQDVEKAADSVGFTFSGIDKPKDINQSFYGLRYGDFVVPLVKAVQELSASSDKKDSVINAIQNAAQEKFDSLQTQINQLRALLLAKNTSAMSGASLDQNVPNPFTGSTTIGYSLPKGTSSAQLQITDMSGNVLAIIPLSGNAGKSTLSASLSGRASGTYLYSLIVDGHLAGTKQMVLF
jgi:hypothetical protein